MSFFRNMSGERWDVLFLFKGLYGAIYTPWFGWSYNIHPNRIRQILREQFGIGPRECGTR